MSIRSSRGARYLASVSFDVAYLACALFVGVGVVAAGAWVHGGHEHETGGVFDAVAGARYGYYAVLQRLTHHLEHRAVVFRHLVERKSTPLCDSDISPG